MILNETFFQLNDRTRLRLKVEDNGNDNWLICLHGLGEHLERHLYVRDLFGKKYNYLFLDHRGHGMSGGKRATIDYFSRFAEDLREVLSFAIEHYKINEYGIYAHSMGALITCDFYKNKMKGLLEPTMIFFSSPAVGFPGVGKILQYSPSSFTNWMKELPITFDIEGENDGERYSHDIKILHSLINDPLVNQHTESKLQFEILHKANEILESGVGFQCPVAIVVGSADKVVCPNRALEFFSAKEEIEQVVVVPGGYHELFVETEKYRRPYIQCLTAFVERHLASQRKMKVLETEENIVHINEVDAHLV